MYIGKIKVTNQWQKLETLIQQQVEGQSSFAFADDKKYQMQGESDFGIRFCNAADTPTDLDVGEVIRGTQTTQYKVEEGANVYVKTFQNNGPVSAVLHISTIGEE